MIALIQPPPEQREAALRAAKHWIEAGCVPSLGELTFDIVADQVRAEKFQLWGLCELSPPTVRGVLITELQLRPAGKVAALICAGGETIGRKEAQVVLEQWAREQGCVDLLIPRGRPGWIKKLRDWKLRSVELVKRL